MSTTAEGLRDRLFNTLDALIDGTISKEVVEAVCYTSEQIIKSAQVELEFMKEKNNAIDNERRHQLTLKAEEREALKLVQSTVEVLNNDTRVQ